METSSDMDVMLNNKEVAVRDVIMHNISPLAIKAEDKLFLADLEIPLKPESGVREYFEEQIKNVLKDTQTAAAIFSSNGDQETSRACYDILDSPNDRNKFISSSQQLAKRLFAAMGEDNRIKPGSLAVCLYEASAQDETHFLALLKLDVSKVFLQRPTKDKQGRKVVNLTQYNNGIPTIRERLQKAALVRPRQDGGDFDLLLLDRQVTEIAADFFARKFLNSVSAIDAKKATDLFYIGAQNAYNILKLTEGESRITSRQADILLQHIDTALQSERVQIAPWVANMNLPEPAKQVIFREIDKRLSGIGEIAVDPSYAEEKLLKKRRFRGQFGLLFEVEADHYDDVVTGSEEFFQNGKLITRLVLEIPGLKWVKK